MNKKITVMPAALFIVALGLGASCMAQVMPATISATAFRPELIYHPRGNFENQTARPLRYSPVGTDFVITNGAEFFNRPLYCMNSGFRIDGGDQPEFSLWNQNFRRSKMAEQREADHHALSSRLAALRHPRSAARRRQIGFYHAAIERNERRHRAGRIARHDQFR